MVDHFQVNMPEILSAQELFQNKVSALQSIADDIASIMHDVGGAPGGADSVSGVQGMLEALQRLETDINELPPGVNPDLEGIGNPGGGHDDGGSQGSDGNGHGGHGPDGDHPGGGHHDDDEDDDAPHGNLPPDHPGKGDDIPGQNPEDELPPDEPLDSPYDDPIGPELPGDDLNPLDEENVLIGGGVLGGALGLGNQNKDEEDSEEEDEEEIPEYVSGANAELKAELDEKQVLLQDAQANLLTMQSEFDQKHDHLGRLEAAFAANHDPKLADRINQLRVEVAELDANITHDQQMVETLDVEVENLAKRWSFVELPPGANVEKIRALEGGETSQWIKDATRNEDNSVNCVNYVVNRMPIPGELPLNAHLWDEQANKFATELGIKVGDVPLEGAVIVMEREHSYANDIYGHVMYVEKVENGIVWVTDNNYPDRMVRLDHLTNEISGPYIKYLYCPWQVVA